MAEGGTNTRLILNPQNKGSSDNLHFALDGIWISFKKLNLLYLIVSCTFKQMPTVKFYRVGLNMLYIATQESEILNCQHILSLHHLLDIHSEEECGWTDWKFSSIEEDGVQTQSFLLCERQISLDTLKQWLCFKMAKFQIPLLFFLHLTWPMNVELDSDGGMASHN